MMTASGLLHYDFMRRALIAAVLVGLAAPAAGIFLVQRRLALIGDGLGHVAVTGVAAGLVLDRSPILVALIAAVTGSIAIESLRARDALTGEIALAIANLTARNAGRFIRSTRQHTRPS